LLPAEWYADSISLMSSPSVDVLESGCFSGEAASTEYRIQSREPFKGISEAGVFSEELSPYFRFHSSVGW